jgi:diacylglycerol O-acyltransferase / wax synthase
MTSVPLTAEDRAILELESPTVVGHVAKVIRLGSPAPDAAQLRALVARRLPSAPRMTWRLDGPPAAPVWRPGEVDLAAHIGEMVEPQPLDAGRLCGEVARMFRERLDRSRPLWRMDLVGPLPDGGAALVWRIHHALADGATIIRLAEAVLWDAEPGAAPPPAPASSHPMETTHRRHAVAMLTRELVPGLRRSPFDALPGTHREVAFAVTPLPALHAAARTLAGATLNDAVLAVVAGGLRRWLHGQHGPVHRLRVKVPVCLHTEGDAVGNRDSFFIVEVPVDEPDPAACLRSIRKETALRKSEHDAQELDEVMGRLARTSPTLRRWTARLQKSGRAFALNVSNVRGPDSEVTLLGAPVRAMYPLAEVAPHHLLRVAALSLGDRLCIGLVADPAVVDDVAGLASAIEQEAAELTALASAPATPS